VFSFILFFKLISKEKLGKFMKKFFVVFCILVLSIVSINAQNKSPKRGKQPYKPIVLTESANLQTIIDKAVSETLAKHSAIGLKGEQLAVTLIDLRDSNNLSAANFRGEEKIYPASVVKMFYLVAIHQWLEDGKIKDSPELRRTMKDMIVDSSNDATQIILDILAGVGSGGELPETEFKKWAYKRNVVNRYFASLDYKNINVCQKTFCEDAYGIEQQFRGKDGINRNKLTTNATAQLMAEIVLGKAVTTERTKQMLDLMSRNWEAKESKVFDGDDQTNGFTGIALKDLDLKGAKLWSKAGWTSKTRHDVAYVETPSGLKFVLCVFTENQAKERDIIPNVARIVIKELGKIK
jgi:beta-lactamase class A